MTDPSSREASAAPGVLKMELRYCPRCGALGVVPAGGRRESCAACACTLRWLGKEGGDETADV